MHFPGQGIQVRVMLGQGFQQGTLQVLMLKPDLGDLVQCLGKRRIPVEQLTHVL